MTPMMNIKYMATMKCMKLTVYIHPYISYKYNTIVYTLIHHIIMIFSYRSTDG